MRLTLRVMGLDVFDLCIDTEGLVEMDESGECTTYPVGFALGASDYDVPDRSME